MRIILIISCLFGLSRAQGYDCSSCLCSQGNTRQNALGCFGYCDADKDNDGILTRQELSDVFVLWAGEGATTCDFDCFMAGEADFPACDNEKLKMFNYFAGFDGDGSSISEPEDFDGWYRDLIQGSGGSEPVTSSGYQAWWDVVYIAFNDEANCAVPCP